jgi:hypothetical protein
MAVILMTNKVNLFVSSVLFVFWYHSPNVLDIQRITLRRERVEAAEEMVCCSILKSYLSDRTFQVRYQAEYTTLYDVHSGVPLGSILGPILYSIFTADIPETEQTLIAANADDTAILASHPNPITATAHLQHHLNQFLSSG